MDYHFSYGFIITDYESVKLPLISQHPGKCKRICSGGHSVKGIERAHEGANPRVHRCLKGGEGQIAKPAFRNVRCVVVATSLSGPAANPVLCARNHPSTRRVVASLEPTYLCPCHCGAKIRVFPRTFYNPAPPRVARDIEHRREGPFQARRGGLSRGHRCGALFNFRVPTACHPEGNWK